jgi:co-chaperonin GroES (HSP10)
MTDATARELAWSKMDEDRGTITDIDLSNHEFVPWSNYVVVKKYTPDTMTRGGLHLPESFMKEKCWGEVVQIGAGVQDLAVGDKVLFRDGCGRDLSIVGKNLVLLEYRDDFENDILGTFIPKNSVDTASTG